MIPFPIIRTLPEGATDAALRADVPRVLTATPKTLPPKWSPGVPGTSFRKAHSLLSTEARHP